MPDIPWPTTEAEAASAQVLRRLQAEVLECFGFSAWHRARIGVGNLMSPLNAHMLKENLVGEQYLDDSFHGR
jgi:hypothetical protein